VVFTGLVATGQEKTDGRYWRRLAKTGEDWRRLAKTGEDWVARNYILLNY